MAPNQVIDTYVDDVVRRLPRAQRSDVGFELRALLIEELDGKAREAGRPADEAMAMALIGAFGAPEDVAQRYRPEGFVIIAPSQSQAFALWALVPVLVQWALTLPRVFAAPEAFPGHALGRLGAWWTTWGLGAFWFPGFLIAIAIVGAWVRHYWPSLTRWTPRQSVGRKKLNRPLLALGLTAWAAGAAVWLGLALYGQQLPGVLPKVFAFDPQFMPSRAAWLPPLWVGHFCVYLMVFMEGRWRTLTRRLDLAFAAALSALMAWFVAAGPIFTSRPTDDAARVALAIIVLVTLVSVAVRLYRDQGGIRPPHGVSGAPSI
jgi:hypothetical protein